MQHNNVTMTIVINAGREHIAREYTSPSDRQTYVEGREGSNFTIRLENRNSFRVLAIPSVDGLSVIDGKPAGDQSSGYIIEARATLDIPGWVVDGGTAAKFFFAGLSASGGDTSYAAQSGNDTAHKGVIGLKVIQEKVSYRNDRFYASGSPVMRSAMSSKLGSFTKGIVDTRGLSSSAPTGMLQSSSDIGSNATLNNASASYTMDNLSFDDVAVAAAAPVQQTLGTGFGDATDFNTTKVDFQRGDLLAVMVIYYDDARGLKKRGIDVSQPVAKLPNAFPADAVGCAVPAGWKK